LSDSEPTTRRHGYEILADELRRRILAREHLPGDRLPTENEIGVEFGMSRTTVREALRVLAAQELIRTAKGAGGGTYVAVPRVSHVADMLGSSIAMLAAAHHLSLDQLMEARDIMEIPAARLAAERRRADDLEELRANVDAEIAGTSRAAHHRDFHALVLKAADNPVLSLVAEPVFGAIVTDFDRGALTERVRRVAVEHHVDILRAIEAGDGEAAERAMREHLAFLRPYYERQRRPPGH
jgi:DNA-binding FadR family transcriptional regulator